ncbi:MAG: hypothetical protein Q9225_000419 [Loekoesia sp. 1 TL-2023]
MSTILEYAKDKVDDELKKGGDRRLPSSDLPWSFTKSGLVIIARYDVWTWQLLKDAIEGVRYCAFRKGVFDEIDVVGILGPGTPATELWTYLSLEKQYSTDASDGYSTTCVVPGTTTTLQLLGTGRRLDSFAMGQILDKAQTYVDSILTEGDRHLYPSEVPWVYSANGLVIKAQMSGWSVRLLKNTIVGIRACSYALGVFEEVLVTSIVDPRGIDPRGNRFLSLLKGPDNSDAVEAPKPLPPGLHSCRDPDTNTRLLYTLVRPVGPYAMQQVLDGAQQEVLYKVAVAGGDHKLTPSEVPWAYHGNGLVIMAEYEGWTWGFLNRTIGLIKFCAFRRGQFAEVLVADVTARDAPSGQRYLSLRIQQ